MNQLIFVVIMLCVQVEATDSSVYKILLTQKGYAQYLHYNVETAPIREFTLCTWLRFNDLKADQSVLSYVVNDGKRILNVYTTSAGANLKILLGRAFSTVAVNLIQDSWHHVCLSYQADHGAWALYLNSRLVSCEASKSLNGFVLPGNGKLLIGYGANDSDDPIGLEGEVFGVNMILISTIERNNPKNIKTYKNQKPITNNNGMVKDNNIEYIILDRLNYVDKSIGPISNIKMTSTKSTNFYPYKKLDPGSEEKEILDMPMDTKVPLPLSKTVWNIVNSNGNKGKFKQLSMHNTELSGSGTQDLPMISTFETPPPLVPPAVEKYKASMEIQQDSGSIYTMGSAFTRLMGNTNSDKHQQSHEMFEIETPPPPTKTQPVFGQWSSSQFSGKVLNYLKSINFMAPSKRVPSTIPLPKLSDSLPYNSNLNIVRVHAPLILQEKRFSDKHSKLKKRHAPQINVKIVEENTRDEILRLHALTRPMQVEVTYRGDNRFNTENRLHRNVDEEYSSSVEDPKSLSTEINTYNKKNANSKTRSVNFIIPHIKPSQFMVNDNSVAKASINTEFFTKNFNKNLKWNNLVNSKNIYTHKQRSMDINDLKENLSDERQETYRFISNHRPAYATENNFKGGDVMFTDLTAKHKLEPGLEAAQHDLFKTTAPIAPRVGLSSMQGQHNFNKPVKIGNALNERLVIGLNEEDKRRSFVGGDEKIPDINRYRSDIDSEIDHLVPPSHVLKVCKNVDLLDRVLYVQPDGSVGSSRFTSPSRVKNIAVIFILNNFKNCSQEGSQLDETHLLFFDWTKTPIKLLGGAYPKKAKSTCGFF